MEFSNITTTGLIAGTTADSEKKAIETNNKKAIQTEDFISFAKQNINIGSSGNDLINFMKTTFSDDRFVDVPAELKAMTFQTLNEERSHFYSALTNVLRSMFETTRSIIANMRV